MAGQQQPDLAAYDGELFRLLVENVVDYAIFVVDPERRVRSWSRGAERLLGYTGAEILGESADRFYTPEDVAVGVPRLEMEEALATGRGEDDRWHVRKDGSRFWASGVMTPLKDESGELQGYAKIMRDRSKWWHAEQASREGEARKTAILEAALDCIITIDHDGNVVEFNPAAERTFGYTRAEVLGREMAGLIIPPSLRDAHREGLSGYLATGEGRVLGRRIEITALRADGTEFPVELAITRISTGGPPLFTAYLRDITERLLQEGEIAERRRLAEFDKDIGLALIESGSLGELLDRCADATVRHLDGAFARIWTLDDSGDVLELQASAGMYTHTDGPHARIPVGQYKIGLIAQERRPHLTNAVIGDSQVPAQDWAAHEGMVAFAGYPLVVGDRLVGVWAMFSRHPLSEATLQAMASVANGIAVGIERNRAAESLAESEAWLSTTLASIGDAVIATDERGHVRFMNPVAETLTGWPQAEAAGRPMEEVFRIINEQTRRPAEHPVSRVLREGVVVGLANHTVLIARDGTETPIEDSAAPIRGDGGALAGVVMVFRDVTEERAARRLLRESEERHRTILDSISDAFCALDRNWRFVYVNRQAEALLGRAGDDLLGKNHWEEYPDTLGTDVERSYRRAVADDVAVTFETFYPPHDRWYEIHAYPSPEGLSVYFRDVTVRKRLDESIREGERQFRTMAESIPQLAWMARADGYIYWYNKRWHEYTGTTPEEMEGWGWQKVHDPDVLPSVMERWKESIASGEPFDMVFPLRGADGRFRPFLTRVMPVRSDSGHVAHWFGTNTDISDRLRIEEELREAKEEAEAANQAKTQFLAVLSHELRTPLNPILLATSSMLDRPCDSEEIRPTLEMIRQNVNLQARLIDDLLDVMRIVRGKMPLHWEVADCHKLINQAIQICRSEVFGGELRLEVDLAAERHYINADPARWQQVLWNLIKNAMKFTPKGGAITIRTRNEGGPDDRSTRLVIEVCDTGIGIGPEVLPRIFDPFQQGETTVTRKFGGLGLGLAISRGIVEGHGGTLIAESKGEGMGTTFRVELPSLPEATPEGDGRTKGRSSGVEPTTPRRILVVEDEPTTLRLMARLLTGLGHEVTTAGTITTALERAEAGDFDLIISDIGLPDGTGLELMRRIVARRGPVRAIALTGYGMEDDIQRSREAGFTAHMTKPIDFSKLEAMIRQVATGGGSNGPASRRDEERGE